MNTLLWMFDASFSTRLAMARLYVLRQGSCGRVLVFVAGWIFSNVSSRIRYALHVAVMLLIAVCLPVTFCASAALTTADESPKNETVPTAPPKGLEFLTPYPQLHGLSLTMTEQQLGEILE